jgi:hypothetical protein
LNGLTVYLRNRVIRGVRLSVARQRWLIGGLTVTAVLTAATLTLPLVLSGQLPPRGLVTGTVAYGTFSRGSTGPAVVIPVDPAANFALTFQRKGHSDRYETTSDHAARFSITLPAGTYRIAPLFYAVYPTDQIELVAGQHLVLALRVMSLGQCLAASDRISAPMGSIPVTQLHAGMIVWTVDAAGHRMTAFVVLVTHRPAAPGQRMIQLVLADGRVVDASPGHPTADGHRVGDLRPGDMLDGSRISTVESFPYVRDTWDLLPSGPTGAYWANDVLLGSTLAP